MAGKESVAGEQAKATYLTNPATPGGFAGQAKGTDIMKTQKSTLAKLCERAARCFLARRGAALSERPLPDVEANDHVLANVRDEDPIYRALMDHAFVVFENNNAQSMEITNSPEARLVFSNRAAGVLEFATVVESTRSRLKADQLRRQKAGATK